MGCAPSRPPPKCKKDGCQRNAHPTQGHGYCCYGCSRGWQCGPLCTGVHTTICWRAECPKGSTPEKDTDTAVGVARTARVVDLIVPTRQNQSARNVTARRSNLIVQIHRKMNPRMNPRVNPRMNPRVNPMNPRMNPRRRPLRTMRATRTMRTLRAVHCSESHQE